MLKTKVLIVDDSAMMRHVLATGLSTDPNIEIIGQASSAVMARELIRKARPDVITLDLEMPKIDGLSFLKDFIRGQNIPTVVISSYSQRGTDIAMKALEAGAIDVIGKPKMAVSGGGFGDEIHDVIRRVKTAAMSHPRPAPSRRAAASMSKVPMAQAPATTNWVIAIGSSTGGVQALTHMLPRFPRNCPGIVIVQHMPSGFTRSFAERLNEVCAIDVKEAQEGDFIRPGTALIAPGGDQHMRLQANNQGFRVYMRDGPQVSFSRPSVDVLFESVAREARKRVTGVILTGMGKDGAQGLLKIRQAGGRTFVQNEESCVVFGMPLAAWNLDAAEKQVALDNMADCILSSVGQTTDKMQKAV